jgi:hypothetical protein
MTGTFRVVQGDKPVFYEFWILEINDNRPVLKLKHFNAGIVGWEDKNSSTKIRSSRVLRTTSSLLRPIAAFRFTITARAPNSPVSFTIYKMVRAAMRPSL